MTSPSPLEHLAGPGNVLAKEAPDAKEFAGLVRSGLVRLKDAENEANSLDSRFDLHRRGGLWHVSEGPFGRLSIFRFAGGAGPCPIRTAQPLDGDGVPAA